MRKLSFLVMAMAVVGGLWVRSGGDLEVLQSQIPEILASDLGPAEPIKTLILGDYDPSVPIAGAAGADVSGGHAGRRIAAPVPTPPDRADGAEPTGTDALSGLAGAGGLGALGDLVASGDIAAEVDRLALTSRDPARTQRLIAGMRRQNMPDLTILLGLRQFLASEQSAPDPGTDTAADTVTESPAPARNPRFRAAPKAAP